MTDPTRREVEHRGARNDGECTSKSWVFYKSRRIYCDRNEGSPSVILCLSVTVWAAAELRIMGHQPDTNTTAMGPDALLPTDEKIGFHDDHNEKIVGDENSIKRNASAISPLDALGLDDWRSIEKKVVRRLDMTILPMLWVGFATSRTHCSHVDRG
jgi:hypothetical protein